VHDAPRCSVALVIQHRQRVLLGRRLNAPEIGNWQLPGGWIGHGESPQQAVMRQANRFPGLVDPVASFLTYTSNLFDNGLHSISLYFGLQVEDLAKIDLQSNDDCADWDWFDWCNPPTPLFLPLRLLRESGYDPLEQTPKLF
jgi:ADP-ribose pyrophosphatase YjhB (NUDIX family)